MSESLSEVERRVLGVLLEKSLAQPQYYPMSVNAIVAACNQKSNRDPLMSLNEDTVWDTLERLRAVGLVSRLMPGGASRVDRFRHEVKTLLGWEKPQWAVMAELLLRGPQTVGELRSRCNRMYPYDDTDAVTAILDVLRESDPPRVAMLPRGAGQSAARWSHQLYYPEEWRNLAVSGGEAVATTTPSSSPASPLPVTPVAPATPATPPVGYVAATGNAGSAQKIAALHEEVEAVQGELADLHEELAELRRRVARMEERI